MSTAQTVAAKSRIKQLSEGQIDSLIARIETAIAAGDEMADDLAILLEVLKAWLNVQERLARNDLTIHKLRKLLGIVAASEAGRHLKANSAQSTAASDRGDEGSVAAKRNGSDHGKRRAEDFAEAHVCHHSHADLASGDPCPSCGNGKVYKYQPAQFVRITGQAPLQATLHVVEQLRCSACQAIFKAPLPPEVTRDGPLENRYGYSAMALVALLKYGAGTPFFRLHMLEKMLKTPVAASTLWDLVERTADAAAPVVRLLKDMAANARLIYSDDTGNRIINIEPEKRKRRGTDKEALRTGVHTSGLIAETPADQRIVLFKTGINHAGEFLDEILAKRPKDASPFIHVSDGLSSNASTTVKGIVARCNAHARRQFVDLLETAPNAVGYVLDVYAEVYAQEAEAKRLQLTPDGRQNWHAEKSEGLMLEMFSWARASLDGRDVEPNSSLGKALRYLLMHHDGLLAFCRHRGAPVDNNDQERALKQVVLHRKNSLFFKEQVGAWVADVLMSLIATASAAEVNVLDYLTAILRDSDAVRRSPAAYLPWIWRQPSNDQTIH